MVCLLAILWLYCSAPCCEWQPLLKWFIHTRWEKKRKEEREIQVIPCIRQNKTSKSTKYPAEEAKRGEGEKNKMLRLWKVMSLRKGVGTNHFQHKNKWKTSESCWHSVTTRWVKPGQWWLTAVKVYPLAWGVHKSWLIRRNQWSVLLEFLINTWGSIHFTSSHRSNLSRLWNHSFLTTTDLACTFHVAFPSTSLEIQFTY